MSLITISPVDGTKKYICPSIVIGGEMPTEGHKVRFWDYGFTLLSEQIVADGGNAVPPLTEHPYLLLDDWDGSYTNVTEDRDCYATYKTQGGRTYIFLDVTATTGTTGTLYITAGASGRYQSVKIDGVSQYPTGINPDITTELSLTVGEHMIDVKSSTPSGDVTLGSSIYPLISDNLRKAVTKVYIGEADISGICFQYFPNLRKVVYSTEVDSIYSNPFSESAIRELYMPKNSSLLRLNSALFKNCKMLKHLILPNISYIYDEAFSGCLSLDEIIIPATVTKFYGDNHFNGCTSLNRIIFTRETPPEIGTNTFAGINPLCRIYVPDASVEAYKTAENWSSFADYIYPISERGDE